MKNYNQVYVKNSFEAAEMYCKAFGAEITREFKDENNTVYEHCEFCGFQFDKMIFSRRHTIFT